ncbi:MAG: CPBP family intramembrane metalloprotease [Eubacteriales bacterium]|nr:CPBP family intramembrane metalloprotease [Eubacteriales bacterium]
MIWYTIEKIGKVVGPVLIHYLAMMIVIIIMDTVGLHVDAAFLTTLTAVLVLPLFLWMYRKDAKRKEAFAGETVKTLPDGFPGEQEKQGRRPVKQKMKPADYVSVAALGVGCNVVLSFLMNILMVFLKLSNETQEALFGSSLVFLVAGVGIIVPVMEEVLFRGLVYKRLREYTDSVWTAVLAAAIFALYHGNAVQALFAFPMGLVLIAVYRKWDTLRAPAVFHMAVNLSSILFSAL